MSDQTYTRASNEVTDPNEASYLNDSEEIMLTDNPPQSGVRFRGEQRNDQQLVDRLLAENRALRQRIDRLSKYRHLAYRDDLTGLCNRRYFDERLLQECNRSSRYGAAVALIVIDLDDFKLINDTAGHATGDAVLNWLGEFLRANCRTTDIPCRIGGDEFAVILTSTDAEGAAIALERLIEKFERAANKPQLPAGLTIEVSCGFAGASDEANTPTELLILADEAMYAAKRQRKAATLQVVAA